MTYYNLWRSSILCYETLDGDGMGGSRKNFQTQQRRLNE